MLHKHTCTNCRKEFSHKKSKMKFCSLECFYNHKRKQKDSRIHSIFENDVGPDEAYILGLICTDGCISYDNHSHRWRMTLSMIDRELINELRSRYTPHQKLYEYTPKKGNTAYTIVTSNDFDINFLRSIGITERKSLTTRVPYIKPNLSSHLVRGIFDGNGCIYNSTTINGSGEYTYKFVSFTTGSQGFANDLVEILDKHGIPTRTTMDCRSHTSERLHGTYYVKIYRRQAIKDFYEWIYQNAGLFLSRKHDKFTDDDIVRPA